jgi:hypothetical protein
MQTAIENAIRMILQAYSKAPSALAERLLTAFQDVAHSFGIALSSHPPAV